MAWAWSANACQMRVLQVCNTAALMYMEWLPLCTCQNCVVSVLADTSNQATGQSSSCCWHCSTSCVRGILGKKNALYTITGWLTAWVKFLPNSPWWEVSWCLKTGGDCCSWILILVVLWKKSGTTTHTCSRGSWEQHRGGTILLQEGTFQRPVSSLAS